MAPNRQAKSTARHKHTVELLYCLWRCAPNASKAGRHVERAVVPRQIVHVADTDIGLWVAVTSYGDQAIRSIDTCALSPPYSGELYRQPGTACYVDERVPSVHLQMMMDGHVLSAIAGLAQRGKVDGPATPSFIDERPLAGLPWPLSDCHTMGLPEPTLPVQAQAAGPGDKESTSPALLTAVSRKVRQRAPTLNLVSRLLPVLAAPRGRSGTAWPGSAQCPVVSWHESRPFRRG